MVSRFYKLCGNNVLHEKFINTLKHERVIKMDEQNLRKASSGGKGANSSVNIGRPVDITDHGEMFEKRSEIYPWRSPIPVVFVEGDNTEMGEEFGKATKNVISKVVKFNVPVLNDILNKSSIKSSDYLETAEQSIIKYTDRGYLDEIKAMAEQASVSYEDLLLTNLNIDIMYTLPTPESHYPLLPDDVKESPLHCSFFSAFGSATTDGSMVAGHNDDGGRYMDQFLAMKVAKPKKGKPFVSPIVPGYIGYHSVVNTSNTFACSTGISDLMKNDEMDPDGVPSWVLFRWLGQYADSTSDAVKRFTSVPNMTCINWCFTSEKEGTQIVEATPKHHAIADFPSKSNEWTVSAGRTLCPELEPYMVTVKHPVTGDYRYDSVKRAVETRLGAINFDEGINIMSDHFDSTSGLVSASENTVCRHMEYAGTFGGTVRSIVVHFNKEESKRGKTTDIAVSLGNPCNGMWRKLSFDSSMSLIEN